jgi:nicotinamidase-related amidase
MSTIALTCRYCRLGWDAGAPPREESLSLAEQAFALPAEQCALVLVDCWDNHYIRSHLERTNRIVIERIAPVIRACRGAGVPIIHAPSPPTAQKYPQWTAYASDVELGFAPPAEAPDWPPPDFCSRTGGYAGFGKPSEPAIEEEIRAELPFQKIVEAIAPQEGDFVVATGEQLHRLLRHRGGLHLLYAGFAANMCVPGRDYGTRAMQRRGYNVILLRDCTTAIEGPGTVETQGLTQAAILEHEMIIGHTATSADLIAACQAAERLP